MKLLFLYISLSCCTEALAFVLTKNSSNNLWIENGFVLLECVLLSLILIKSGLNEVSRLVVYFIPAWVVVWTVSTFMFDGSFFKFNVYGHLVEAVVLVVMSAALLVRLSSQIDEDIFRDARFWIASAILILFAVNMLVYSLANYFFTELSSQAFLKVWVIHSISNIIANLLFSMGFVCKPSKTI